jgi:hypothetical protein
LGTRLCMQEISHESSKAHSTALVLLNTRMIRAYKSVKEMVEPDSEAPWGNRFAFLHVPIPEFKDPKSLDPLEFVWEAHRIIKRKRSSLDVYLTSRLLEIMRKLRGPEVHIYSIINHLLFFKRTMQLLFNTSYTYIYIWKHIYFCYF